MAKKRKKAKRSNAGRRKKNSSRGLAAQPLKRDRWYRGSMRISKSGQIQFRKG